MRFKWNFAVEVGGRRLAFGRLVARSVAGGRVIVGVAVARRAPEVPARITLFTLAMIRTPLSPSPEELRPSAGRLLLGVAVENRLIRFRPHRPRERYDPARTATFIVLEGAGNRMVRLRSPLSS